jgi:hypothetical protein
MLILKINFKKLKKYIILIYLYIFLKKILRKTIATSTLNRL